MSINETFIPLTEPIEAFRKQLQASDFQPPVLCGEQTFPLLLAALPAMRLTPGLATLEDLGKEFFTSIPYCRDEESTAQTLEHLSQVYGYTDRAGLEEFCANSFQLHRQYLDFESFWENRPAFDLGELDQGAREVFTACSDFARQFQPFVGRRGFLAWDISETLGHLRAACACRMISKEEYQELSAPWMDQAAAFRDWGQFALDLVCGGAFWAYRMGSSQQEIADYVDLNLRLVRQLLREKTAWCGRMWWRRPGTKAFCLSAAEMRPLLRNWEGAPGCLATDRITVDGRPVGYCYREAPIDGLPDSGWRFLAGDEEEDYLNNPSHSGVYHLNDLCNFDPDILPLLSAPHGTAYVRGTDGMFHTAQ